MEFKCDICGGILEMDAGGQFARCEFCGMKYPKERLQAKIQEIRGTVKVDGPVSIHGIETKDDLLKNAETYLSLGRYFRAEESFEKVVEKYPDEPEGWWGVFRAGMLRNHENPVWSKLIEYDSYAQTAMRILDYSAKYKAIWDEFIDSYGKEVHINRNAKSIYDQIEERDIGLLTFPERSCLKELQSRIFNSYKAAFLDGKLTFFGFNVYTYSASNDMLSLVAKGEETASLITGAHEYVKLQPLKNHVRFLDYPLHYEPNQWPAVSSSDREIPVLKEFAKRASFDRYYHIDFFLGSTMIVTYAYDSDGLLRERQELLILDEAFTPDQVTKIVGEKVVFESLYDAYHKRGESYWKQSGKCSFCGSSFKNGFLGAKCIKCGRKKNY